jgi:DAACS family dicarboxylate/amino acid:cation (Na+ or H+) symporter
VLFGFVIGTVAGIDGHACAGDVAAINILVDFVAKPVGQLFLNLLFMLVLPLMFSALVLGVAERGDVATLGHIGSRTLLCAIAVTFDAVALPKGIGLMLGVDRLLDMCRTALNVTGDRATAVTVARSGGRERAPAYRPDARSGIVAETASATAPSLS